MQQQTPHSLQMSTPEQATHGFSVLNNKNISAEKAKTCDNTKTPLTQKLTPGPQNHLKTHQKQLPSDLSEVVSAWSELPEYIKQAVMALIKIS